VLAESTAREVNYPDSETTSIGRRVAWVLLITSITAVTTALVVVLWLLRRSVSQPLRHLAGALGEIADGRLDDVILPPLSRDEVGGTITAAKVFLEKLIRNRKLEAAATVGRAARDRQAAAMDVHTQDFGTSSPAL
jgi:methyl-accepting chemotaxis protein